VDQCRKKCDMPPRVYIDNRTIIREIGNVVELRRGDHCLVTINLMRCVSPMIDRMISWIGSFECIYFYHHFIMVDDVSHVDEHGVPRTHDGKMAEIVEYSNTIRQGMEEMRVKSGGRFHRIPATFVRFIMQKCHCVRLPLADYGDTPHIYTVIEDRTPEDRERVVKGALEMVAKPRKYHFYFNNCEHVSNLISQGRLTSPEVHFANWVILRFSLCCVGLFFLNWIAGCCYSKYCVTCPWLAFFAYHLFTTIPVVSQALISYALIARSVMKHYRRRLLKDDDWWHLMGKELGRAVVAGGGAAIPIAFMPLTVSKTRYFLTACAICSFSYLASDLVYNLLCHAVMRLVLLPVWGKVWLISCGSGRTASKNKVE
jgi:hypothetical protein